MRIGTEVSACATRPLVNRNSPYGASVAESR